jgi:hypothetical protein
VAVRPVSPEGLARHVAALAVQLRPPDDRAAVRLGVDGVDGPSTRDVADAVAAELTESAVPVARVSAGDFVRQRSLRLEHGRDDADAYFDGWYDVAALRREVLDPLGEGGSMTWLPRLRDAETDRPAREPRRPAPPGTVAVIDGCFLLRQELAGALDLTVHLALSPAARVRRIPAAEAARVLPAWERYLLEHDPAATAMVLVRHDDPRHPALVTLG